MASHLTSRWRCAEILHVALGHASEDMYQDSSKCAKAFRGDHIQFGVVFIKLICALVRSIKKFFGQCNFGQVMVLDGLSFDSKIGFV